MQIKRYRTPSGRCPVDVYLNELSKEDRADIIAVLEAIEEHGLYAPLVSMRQIKGKLWELRISQNRIFYVVMKGAIIVLLHAYKKQGQKASRHEIETALRRMAEVFEEK